MNQVQKLLIIGFVWPEPNSSAAGGRMMQLISLFKAQGFSITFASPAKTVTSWLICRIRSGKRINRT
jgi:hypothetical protein